MNTKWEYRVEKLGSIWQGANAAQLEAMLNEVSEEGWELVEIVPQGNTVLAILRRSGSRSDRPRPRRWPM